MENKERERERDRRRRRRRMGECGREGKQRKGKEKPLGYKFFFALALTRLSNTVLRMGVCAVWNGFMAV